MTDKNDLLFKFKEYLKVLNRSVATIDSYTGSLNHFFESVSKDIQSITRKDIEQYIAGIYEHRMENSKPYSINTICVKVRSIKRFFEFLEKTNIIFIDPSESIKEPQKDVKIIRAALTNKEVNRILDQPNLGTNKGIRERAILEMFYSTGIRLNELCALTVYDADLQERMLRINKGKGKKDRVVPFGKHAARFLREYITKVRPHYARKNKTSRYLFINQSGKPMTNQVVAIMVRNHAKAAKIKKRVTPHIFRHTFASTLIKNNADIVAVQKMLGHSDLGTTQIYIRSLGLDIKKVHQKTHPRERDRKDRNAIKPEITRMISKWT